MNIYHYTDLNGLKGILSSNAFWATNFYFMNDAHELQHGIKCIENALGYLEGDLSKRRIDFIKDSLKQYNPGDKFGYYNISFCKNPDLLSQWRGYGLKQGVCLEFDRDELFDCLDFKNREASPGNVIYTDPDKTLKTKKEIIDFFKKRIPFKNREHDGFAELSNVHYFLNSVTPFFKHDSFSEEKEYRIVFKVAECSEDIEFRVNEHGLIPYIVVGVNNKNPYSGLLPLKSIKIGPCKNAELVEKGIQLLLRSCKYYNVNISTTKSPFRG